METMIQLGENFKRKIWGKMRIEGTGTMVQEDKPYIRE